MVTRTINHDRDQVTTSSPRRKPARLCRTPQEIAQAGWDDGADDPPLTDAQVTRLAALLAPYIPPRVSDHSALKSA